MTLGDWFHSAVKLVVGFLLGIAAYSLATVLDVSLWLSAVIVVVPFLAIIAFAQFAEGLWDRLLNGGVYPANLAAKTERKPLLRVLSAPIGFAVGALAGILGFSDQTMAML